MASRQDILLEGNEPVFIDGDFVIGDSDDQHIQDTIYAYPGWWKENPADGVGITDYANSPGLEQQLARSIKIQLQADGYKVGNPEIKYVDGLITINPNVTIN